MTPRAWSYGLLFAGILWAALIVAWWLILAAQTVGVEAWHDSAVPQGAFVNVTPGATEGIGVQAGRDRKPSQPARLTPSPSPRAVPRLAARRSAGTPQRGQDSRPTGSMTGTASWFASPANVSAAGPALRAALGSGWRGTVVTVTGPAGSAVTVLGDWMAMDRLIDLDRSIFPAVCGPLSLGLCRAEVDW